MAMEVVATPAKSKKHKAMTAQQQKENLARVQAAIDRAKQAGE